MTVVAVQMAFWNETRNLGLVLPVGTHEVAEVVEPVASRQNRMN